MAGVLLVSGSLRRGSYNTVLLRQAANALPRGVGHVWFEGIAGLPPYSEDEDGERVPAAAERLRQAIAAADAVLIATPEYNGSIPGGLKNAVDWASRPFPGNAWRDKPVAVMGASTGIFGAVWAQAELRKSLGIARARVIDAELAVGGAHEAFLPSGALRDPGLASGLRDVVEAVVDARQGSRAARPEVTARA
jgi:chromate reductase